MTHYQLVSTSGGSCFDLRAERPLVLGRALACDLPVLDPTISRRHAELSLSEGRVMVRDLGSSNGTIVRGRRIPANQRTPISVGDTIEVGSTVVIVQPEFSRGVVEAPEDKLEVTGSHRVAPREESAMDRVYKLARRIAQRFEGSVIYKHAVTRMTQATREMLDEKWPYGSITWLIGDTLDPATTASVAELVQGRRTMVSLDAEHAAPHVIREIQDYGKFVTPGCYLVVEDGIFDLIEPERAHLGGARIPLEGGPLQAMSVLVGDPEWQRDAKIERMSARSHHPCGFWRRKEAKPPRAAAAKAAKGQAGALTAS